MTEDDKKFLSERHLSRQPFSFEGGGDIVVLLFHGWSSTPYEMRALGTYLHEHGYSVHAPMLLGHGTQPEDLEGIHWTQWVDQAQEEYDKLVAQGKRVVVGGMSMGGSLALLLAQKNDVAGVILMSTPYRMRREVLGKCIFWGLRPFQKYKTKKYPKIGDSTCLTQKISYQRYPIISAYEAFRLITVSRHHLEKVIAPTMIIQSEHDHLITQNSIFKFEWNLGSSEITKKILSHAYHNFIGDADQHFVFEDIHNFLETL